MRRRLRAAISGSSSPRIASSILSDRHASARGLLRLTVLRARPEAAFLSMAGSLAGASGDPPFPRALVDFRHLFATLDAPSLLSAAVRTDDLSDWVITLRRGDASLLDDEEPIDASVRADAVEHAIARWRAASSLPWLTAAMMLAPAGHPTEAELTCTAAAIAPSAPAWPTLAFHRVRLLLARDQFEPAGLLLAEIRRASPNPDPAFDNLLRAAELRVAPSLEALLIAGVRRLLGDAGYVEDVIDDEKDRELELGDDVVDILNERLPLSLLMRAADNQALPPAWRRRVTRAAFTRALLLGDAPAIAAAMAPMLRVSPELAGPLKSILGAASAERSARRNRTLPRAPSGPAPLRRRRLQPPRV